MKKMWWSISTTIWRYELEIGKKAKVSISTMYRYARVYDKELEKMGILPKKCVNKKTGKELKEI